MFEFNFRIGVWISWQIWIILHFPISSHSFNYFFELLFQLLSIPIIFFKIEQLFKLVFTQVAAWELPPLNAISILSVRRNVSNVSNVYTGHWRDLIHLLTLVNLRRDEILSLHHWVQNIHLTISWDPADTIDNNVVWLHILRLLILPLHVGINLKILGHFNLYVLYLIYENYGYNYYKVI